MDQVSHKLSLPPATELTDQILSMQYQGRTVRGWPHGVDLFVGDWPIGIHEPQKPEQFVLVPNRHAYPGDRKAQLGLDGHREQIASLFGARSVYMSDEVAAHMACMIDSMRASSTFPA